MVPSGVPAAPRRTEDEFHNHLPWSGECMYCVFVSLQELREDGGGQTGREEGRGKEDKSRVFVVLIDSC